jgi:hypothetical protein
MHGGFLKEVKVHFFETPCRENGLSSARFQISGIYTLRFCTVIQGWLSCIRRNRFLTITELMKISQPRQCNRVNTSWMKTMIAISRSVIYTNTQAEIYTLIGGLRPTDVSLIMDHLHYRLHFDLNKSGQKFHHSLKEHHKISNIPKFRCEML